MIYLLVEKVTRMSGPGEYTTDEILGYTEYPNVAKEWKDSHESSWLVSRDYKEVNEIQ